MAAGKTKQHDRKCCAQNVTDITSNLSVQESGSASHITQSKGVYSSSFDQTERTGVRHLRRELQTMPDSLKYRKVRDDKTMDYMIIITDIALKPV